jgi:hypothetical protein
VYVKIIESSIIVEREKKESASFHTRKWSKHSDMTAHVE